MRFEKEFIDEVRSQAVIETLVQDYVPLKKQGKSLVGCCPFHLEKTPSFHVSAVKKLYHCFGCGKGGDVYNFIMDKENLSFIEAVKFLAERSNIDIPESAKDAGYDKRVALQSRILEMNNIALDTWKSALSEVEEYLLERNMPDSMITDFEFGFSSDSRNVLISILQDEGFTDEEIKESGLVVSNEKETEFYDKFRNRLMIPIKDVKGRVVAFGGRSMNGVEPKYLNSPETALYTKGDHLYGLFQSKDAIKAKGFVILTEGYFDALALYKHGIENTVASLGTAITENQIELLKRLTDKILICYDGDEAGQKASERAAEMLNARGFTVKIVVLPDNSDPDDYLTTYGIDTFNERRKKAVGWFAFYVDRLKKRFDIRNVKAKGKAVEEVLETLSRVISVVERREYFDLAMKLLRIDSTLHHSLWYKISHKNRKIRANELSMQSSLAETKFLEIAVSNAKVKDNLKPQLEDLEGLSIMPILQVLSETEEGELDFASTLEKITDESDKKVFCTALFKAEEIIDQYGDDIEEEAECCIMALKQLKLESQLEEITAKIKSEEDEEILNQLLTDQMVVLDKIAAI